MTDGRSLTDDLGSDVVARARAWIGTPYVHQASCAGAGTDCLGLVRGIWRELIGPEPETPPSYSADWSESTGDEILLAAALRHLEPIPVPTTGDVLLFRMRDHGVAKHLAILSSVGLEPGRIIHAYSGHSVCETYLASSWVRRLVACFRFPKRGA